MTELFKTVTKKPIVTPDGIEHATLEDAQKHLLTALFLKSTTIATIGPSDSPTVISACLAQYILTSKSELLAIIGKQPRKPRTPKVQNAAPATPKKK